MALFQHGDIALGCLLFLFSVVFPITKATALVVLLFTWREEKSSRRAAIESWSNWVLSRVSAYSMLDVFVIAVIVIGFKEFPLGTRFDYHWGILVFALAIILSIVAATVFERRQTAWERSHRLADSA